MGDDVHISPKDDGSVKPTCILGHIKALYMASSGLFVICMLRSVAKSDVSDVPSPKSCLIVSIVVDCDSLCCKLLVMDVELVQTSDAHLASCHGLPSLCFFSLG